MRPISFPYYVLLWRPLLEFCRKKMWRYCVPCTIHDFAFGTCNPSCGYLVTDQSEALWSSGPIWLAIIWRDPYSKFRQCSKLMEAWVEARQRLDPSPHSFLTRSCFRFPDYLGAWNRLMPNERDRLLWVMGFWYWSTNLAIDSAKYWRRRSSVWEIRERERVH